MEDLLHTAHIYKLATQGRADENQWVTSYQLKTSVTGLELEFEHVTSSSGDIVTFNANSDRDTVVTNTFSPRVARYVRLYPQTWNVHIALRWEVYGCAENCSVISIPDTSLNTTSITPGTAVSISCDAGFAFGETHSEDTLDVTCNPTGEWDIDLSTYSCSGKKMY